MKFHARILLLALLVGATVMVISAPAAQAAFGVEKFVAVNCSEPHEECAQEGEEPKEPSKAEAEEQGYTQAGGHVPYGVTDFKVTGAVIPEGVVTHVRVDVPPGLATSPAAVPQCSAEQFGEKEAIEGTGFFGAPACAPNTKIGVNKVTVFDGVGDLPLKGDVYNLVQREGLASEFGVALELPKPFTEFVLKKAFAEHPLPLPEPEKKFVEEFLETQQYFAHTLIEGNVEWGQQANGTNQGDYHDYFEINVSPALPLLRSRLLFYGRSGEGDFITNATRCPGNSTTTLKLTEAGGATAVRTYTPPVGLSGCNLVPFDPSLSLLPATAGHDEPDGITTEVGLKRHPGKEEVDSSQLKTAVVRLPEGMTLNPSAAAGLSDCTPAQARIHSSVPGVACPSASEIGKVSLEVPTLPPGSLNGTMYLGGPESGPITGPPYTMYLDAESARYGVSVRLKGEVIPNEVTGQLTTVFSENPEQPFTKATLHFREGALAPVANPLVCGAAFTDGAFVPFTETAARFLSSGFIVSGCPSPLPFSLSQSTQNQPPGNAGARTSYALNLDRADGQQYLSQVKTVLPAGLIGLIPAVTLCGEPQAAKGECPESSHIGTVRVAAGAGPTPYSFTGSVYITGPYNGAPFGLSIVVPAVAGPFNLGNVITRGTINIDPYTARVIATSTLPSIVKGIPLRLKHLSVEVNKQGFLINPTNCGVLATETTLTSTFGAVQTLSSPFQVSNCSKLSFKPSFKASTGAKTSKANGASLETTINQPAGQANIKSVRVQLPRQLPSRLTTLQKACPEKTFANNPYECPRGSFVGGARANTPALPGKLKGPAILVSHGGAAFPDLDLVMEANGVRIILVGNTNIKKGITTTTFASAPDAPVSSITVNLPVGPHSALSANANLCASKLVMPTTITAQNGVVRKQNTRIAVKNCGVRVVGRKTIRNVLYLTVQTFAAGRISGKGRFLRTVFRRLNRAQTASLKVPLTGAGLHRRRPLKIKVRVGFVPKQRGAPTSVAFTTVVFR